MIRLTNSESERAKATRPVSDVTTEEVTALEPMTLLEHTACVLFLAFGVPNGVLTAPAVTFLVGRFVLKNVPLAFGVLFAVALPFALLPQPFVASTLHSWMAEKILKYFSFRFIVEEVPPTMPIKTTGKTKSVNGSNGDAKGGGNGDADHDDNGGSTSHPRPQILVAPPHGVFPYGNILSMLVWPWYVFFLGIQLYRDDSLLFRMHTDIDHCLTQNGVGTHAV